MLKVFQGQKLKVKVACVCTNGAGNISPVWCRRMFNGANCGKCLEFPTFWGKVRGCPRAKLSSVLENFRRGEGGEQCPGNVQGGNIRGWRLVSIEKPALEDLRVLFGSVFARHSKLPFLFPPQILSYSSRQCLPTLLLRNQAVLITHEAQLPSCFPVL